MVAHVYIQSDLPRILFAFQIMNCHSVLQSIKYDLFGILFTNKRDYFSNDPEEVIYLVFWR